MNQKICLKVVLFAIISIIVFSVGIASFAAKPINDSINWSYLNVCSYGFYPKTSDSLYCEGSTVVPNNVNAYVKIELQQLGEDGWATIRSLSDEDYMAALIDDIIVVDDGYTYRLKIIHKAKSLNGVTLESYTHYSNTIGMHITDFQGSGDE